MSRTCLLPGSYITHNASQAPIVLSEIQVVYSSSGKASSREEEQAMSWSALLFAPDVTFCLCLIELFIHAQCFLFYVVTVCPTLMCFTCPSLSPSFPCVFSVCAFPLSAVSLYGPNTLSVFLVSFWFVLHLVYVFLDLYFDFNSACFLSFCCLPVCCQVRFFVPLTCRPGVLLLGPSLN